MKIAKKKGLMDKLAQLIDSYEEDEDEEFEEEEVDENEEAFIIRLTKSYNFIVDAIEFMPSSTSKEYKFKKDQEKARRFYLNLSNIAKDYFIFLNRMKKEIGA